MFCPGRPSAFGIISSSEIFPQWGIQGNRCGGGPMRGFGPWGGQPRRGVGPLGGQHIRGLLQEVIGHSGGCNGPWDSERPGCLDHSGHRHCRTHCHGQCDPETLLEQFIIEEIIGDKHKNQVGDRTQKRKDNLSGTKEIVTNAKKSKETDSSSQVENRTQSHPGEIVTTPPKPWSVEVDMNGCEKVRAWTEDGKIMVEGHTRNAHGFMSVKRAMTLPDQVRGETLKATLGKEGKLTLTEAQENKGNVAMDISVQSEEHLLISSKEQTLIKNIQDNSVEAQKNKHNEAMDIPVQSEENLQITTEEQTLNKDIQDNSADKESSEPNVNVADSLNKLIT